MSLRRPPIYTDIEHLDADMNRLIEGGKPVEVIAARMLKTNVPLIKEVLYSTDLSYLAGFARGTAMVVTSLVISLPENMRQGMKAVILRELENALDIALKGPPKEMMREQD